MHRRKAVMVGVAAFAIGAAFAAQPVSVHADWSAGERVQRPLWAPGTNGIMAIYETSTVLVAPPR